MKTHTSVLPLLPQTSLSLLNGLENWKWPYLYQGTERVGRTKACSFYSNTPHQKHYSLQVHTEPGSNDAANIRDVLNTVCKHC